MSSQVPGSSTFLTDLFVSLNWLDPMDVFSGVVQCWYEVHFAESWIFQLDLFHREQSAPPYPFFVMFLIPCLTHVP